MPNLAARLRQCFATLFPDLTQDAIGKASVDSVSGWDSVAMVTLVSLIEEEFATSIPLEDLDQFTSFPQIEAYLRNRSLA